jgi:hypothetical protein
MIIVETKEKPKNSSKHRIRRKTFLKNIYDENYEDFGGASQPTYEFERMQFSYELLQQVIEHADPTAIKAMMSLKHIELDEVFESVVKETYKILYGDNSALKIEPTVQYISELDAELKEQMRRMDLGYFCSDAMNMQMNWHHIEWAWLIKNFPMTAILAARDHGKSYFFSNAFPIWMAYRYDPKAMQASFHNGKLMYLFSNTASQATDLLEILKDNIESIDLLKERLFPEFREVWSKTSIKFKNGCRLRAKGFGSSVRGAHPGTIIVDDPLKDNVLYSEIQRERNKAYFNAVIMNMLIPGGQIAVVGTPFHNNDLYVLFKHSVDFAYREYPALDSRNQPLWKERHSFEDLMMRKRHQGNIIFTREFLCKPISDESAIFTEKALQTSLVGMRGFSYVNNIEQHTVKFKRVVTGCDFALSGSVGADYTSFATFGIDEHDNMWLLNLYHKKGVGYSEQKRTLRRIWRDFRPNLMLLEANMFQKIYTETLKDETDMPVKPFVTDRRKHLLEEGVPGLSILFENGKMKFPYATKEDREITDMVLDEFRSIGWTEHGVQGVSSHDDIVMSVWLARMALISNSSEFIFDFIGQKN